MEEKIDLIASYQDMATRLDVFVSKNLGLSRSHAARIIDQGRVLVDGDLKKPSFRLRSGMHVHGAWEKQEETQKLTADEILLDIIYEDPWIVVISKPAGMTVHPGAGTTRDTLVNALLSRYPEIVSVGDPARPGIVHRLDKLTSGIMVIARTPEAHAILSAAFKAHEHRREYLAVCYGRMTREKGTIETFMQRNPRDRKRMTSRTGEGRKAVTHWEAVTEWKEFSLLRLSLETGRTHQIRVHLSDTGHPVAGDPVYGGRRRANAVTDAKLRAHVKGIKRQMLHAAMLGIRHPDTGEYMEFTCDMPDDMKVFIAVLEEIDVPSLTP
ncbi:MAG: Ribosomal large subunit pseudouridine synthase D [Deltaproteobacteria bacterium ADurb.BinA179]|nr:MAG: Ribosomal large subunit pseudouridine synthase D [Deltaproteobacteria bacterium ADurb.BinA179]HNS91088.1 RluA family pseudouridine synthase [Deltaproteobacteria bacterium]